MPKMRREMRIMVVQDRLWNAKVVDDMVKNKEATTGVVRPPSPQPKEQGIRHVNLENLSTATNKPVYP